MNWRLELTTPLLNLDFSSSDSRFVHTLHKAKSFHQIFNFCIEKVPLNSFVSFVNLRQRIVTFILFSDSAIKFWANTGEKRAFKSSNHSFSRVFNDSLFVSVMMSFVFSDWKTFIFLIFTNSFLKYNFLCFVFPQLLIHVKPIEYILYTRKKRRQNSEEGRHKKQQRVS